MDNLFFNFCYYFDLLVIGVIELWCIECVCCGYVCGFVYV